ncbi:MAG: hypothetical protein MJZ38_02950 [archaeon]|nr:hypothetical protein [archaeon]
MNAITVAVLVPVLALVLWAAFRTCRMVRDNDLCYACPRQGTCHGHSPINCTFRKED